MKKQNIQEIIPKLFSTTIKVKGIMQMNDENTRKDQRRINKVHMTKEENESNLLIDYEELDEILHRDISQCDLSKGMWYIDNGTIRHMIGKKASL